ncbi:MAG TPA: beta-galactosidase, partial [Gemmataceae bacterium]|nr:beta-galactosidase [Gemmataceae bacterium]
MRRGTLLLALGCLWVARPADAQEWKPAKGPLMTRWAKDVTPERVLPEYPRPQMQRKAWQNLNGLWQLAFAKEGEEAPVGKELPERILVPFPVESALSGVMKRADRLWYRRHFTVPKDWAGQRLLLHFGAVDWEATVWVNGKKLGSHKGGYDGFTFDVTDALKADGKQELIVGAWDPTDGGTQPRGKQVRNPEGIYYTPTTGIWQTVWLEPVPQASVEGLKIVPDVDGKRVRLTVRGRGTGPEDTVLLVVTDGGRRVVTLRAKVGAAISIPCPSPKLWSPESPFLYDLRVELEHGGKVVDAVDSYFAMRKIEVGKDDGGATRLLLNGKFVFQVGPLDQGFWPDGLYTAPTDAALKYDIEITKKLGFNMTRKHVKV